MSTILIVVLAVLWYLTGVGCAIGAWTYSWDLIPVEIPLMLVVGVFGPIIGFAIIAIGTGLKPMHHFDDLGKDHNTVIRKWSRPRDMDYGARQKYNL